MTTPTTAREIPGCVFSQPYQDFDGSSQFADCPTPATWLVWVPTHDEHEAPPEGTVLGACGDHVIVMQTEVPDAEVVQISDLPMTCVACREPVWAKYAAGHATVAAANCDWCAGLAERRAAAGIDIPTAAEHPACSCPEYAAYEKAMEEGSS